MRIHLLVLLTTINIFSQEPARDTAFTQNTAFLKAPQKKKKDTTDLTAIKNTLTSSAFFRGYQYSFSLKQLGEIDVIKNINEFFHIQNKTILNTPVFKNNNSLKFNGYVNMNGFTQIVTLKGKVFNDYKGDYTFQVSYHLSTTDYNINVSRLVRQEVQKGLALKLKINLENRK